MTIAAPDADPFAVAWLQHAAAVESKLDTMARTFATLAEQAATQNDPTRYPDPFAVAALNAAATLCSIPFGQPPTTRTILTVADTFERWLREPRTTHPERTTG